MLHKERGGIKAGVLSVPIRYINTPSEMLNLKDLEDITSVLSNIILR
jgi:putative aminopeptidase FrvX